MIDQIIDPSSQPGPAGKLSVCEFETYLRETQETVALLAHYYWLMRGCPEGSPEIDWYRAEETIEQEFLEQLDLGLPC
jgi:hypothetical protein